MELGIKTDRPQAECGKLVRELQTKMGLRKREYKTKAKKRLSEEDDGPWTKEQKSNGGG